MEYTAVLGRGVNPSPVPEPHSFQKETSDKRANARRANAIIKNAQIRENSVSKR